MGGVAVKIEGRDTPGKSRVVLQTSHGGPEVRNEKGSKVEADVAMCPLLSLSRREENRDGEHYTTTDLLLRFSFESH